MKNKFVERWSNAEFINEAEVSLKQVFIEKKNELFCDFRGIRIGSTAIVDLLIDFDFQNSILSNVDLTDSKISCSFIGGDFKNLNFTKSHLDSCRMSKAKFFECSFESAKARIDLTDSHLENCCFNETNFTGSGLLEYGGRRVRFINCSFAKAKFNRIELRASRFINCKFSETTFLNCDLRGVKFEGESPDPNQFTNCQT